MHKIYTTLATVLTLIVPAHATQSNASSGDASKPAEQLTEARIQELIDARVQELMATEQQEQAKSGELEFKTYWKNGLQFVSKDKANKIQIGGRIYNDWANFSPGDRVEAAVGSHPNGTEFRSSRIYVKGTLDERYFFKANYDFAGTGAGKGGPSFKDVYMGVKKVPGLQHLQVGRYKEPMGLEHLTSSKYTTFMERSFVAGLQPSRSSGLMAFGTLADKRMTFAAGAFRNTNQFGKDSGDGGYAVTARLSGVPITNTDHSQMIHLGLSASHRHFNGGNVGLKLRPEAHLSPAYLITGDLAADSLDRLGLEWASVNGPFHTQAEFTRYDLDGDAGGASPNFFAYYGQASWFVTGESKPYSAKSGAFGRVKPKTPWGHGGWGAWELAARYSAVNLKGPGVNTGKLNDITLGVNWYLSSFARMMVNYVRSDLKAVGQSNAYMLRFQVDF